MQTNDKQVLIVEDNKYSMNKVCEILKDIKGIILLKAKDSGEAYRYALEYSIDLFIVDIILNSKVEADISGIKFAETIRSIERYEMTPMIFTTSLEDPKLHAYTRLHCYQYFEKPYDDNEFKDAVIKTLKVRSAKIQKDYFYLKIDGTICPIKTKEIVYIENKVTGINIYCSDGEVFSAPYKSSRQMLLELNSDNFIKCNKRNIVNRDYIRCVDISNRMVILKGEFAKLSIGRGMMKSFKDGFLDD